MAYNNHENKSNCPCKACDGHNADCHSICEKYKEWSEKLKAKKLEIIEDRKRRNDCCRAPVKAKVGRYGRRENQ